MALLLEIFHLMFRLFWSIVEATYRLVIPVPRKKIDGEIVLITGGGGKIGECIAMELAKLNVTIVLLDVNEEATERVASKVREQGATVFAFRCDLTDKDEVYRVAEEVKRQVGHVTILMNNAGIVIAKSFMNCSDKELAKTVEINTTAHFWTTKAFLPHMLEMNYGHIVTTASIAGFFGCRNVIAYCASKYGAVGFHESLHMELRSLGKYGVNTTCLCPVFVDTPLLNDCKIVVRFPSIFPMLSPEYVAEQLVDGMLRNKQYVILPKSVNIQMMLMRVMPHRFNEILNEFTDAGVEDKNLKKAQALNNQEGKADKEEKKLE